MNRFLAVHHASKDIFEVDYVVHSKHTDGEDVYSCHRISNYDGMPIGDRQWIPVWQFVAADVVRLQGILPVKEA